VVNPTSGAGVHAASFNAQMRLNHRLIKVSFLICRYATIILFTQIALALFVSREVNKSMTNNKRSGSGHDGDVSKGLAAGIIAGLVAAWTMNQFQALLSKLAEGEERSHGAQSMQQGSPQHGAGRELEERGSEDETDDATERLANIVSEGVFDHQLTEGEKSIAGTAIHYGFGVTSGALYGALAELAPGVTTGAGLPFGATIWLTADEGMVPLLGLSKSPTEYPPSVHAYALAAHFVFGLTTELVRRAVHNVL
jgi:hypothetical protein